MWTVGSVCAVVPLISTVIVWLLWPARVEAWMEKTDARVESLETHTDRCETAVNGMSEVLARQTGITEGIKAQLESQDSKLDILIGRE